MVPRERKICPLIKPKATTTISRLSRLGVFLPLLKMLLIITTTIHMGQVTIHMGQVIIHLGQVTTEKGRDI